MRYSLNPVATFQLSSCWAVLQLITACHAQFLCSIFNHRSAIIDNRLFFSSGFYNFDDGQPFRNTSSLYWLPLNDKIDISGPIDLSLLGSINLPDVALVDSGAYTGGTFFYDRTSLYPYGAMNVPIDDAINNIGWVFDTTGARWSRVQAQGENFTFSNNSDGAHATDPSTGRSFYVGGSLNRTIIFQSSNSTPTATTGMQGPDVYHGAMVYLRKGLSGVLLALGGRTWNSTGQSQQLFSNISVYDISSDAWHTQTATGDIPKFRSNFCAGVSAAPDDSSFQITIYGGDENDKFWLPFSDVYVLSIPSFRWIKISDSYDSDSRGQDSSGRFSHTCDVWNEAQLIVSGGSGGFVVQNDSVTEIKPFNLICNKTYPPIKVLDTSTYTWRTSFDPNLEYVVPDSVTSVIGGSSSGGATLQAPSSGWDSEELESIFSKTITRDTGGPANTSSDTPTHTATPGAGDVGSNLSKGAIAGIAVAAAMAIIFLAAGALVWLNKRHGLTPKKLVGTVKTLVAPDNHWHKPELEASANARHEIGISEPRPHELHEDGATRSELPGSFPPLSELP